MSYTDVFGNQTLPPSEFGYSALTLTTDTTVVWPYNSDSTSTSISKIVNISCSAGNALTLPDAREVSTGEDFLLRNVGANTLTVKDSGGVTIATVASGAASYFYITDNTTQAGVYGVIGFGVGTSTVDAAGLIGYGIVAIGASLNQAHPVFPTNSTMTADATHRAKLLVFTGGVASLNLTSASTLGDNYFVMVRNDGTGTLTIDPAASETLDGLTTMQVQPSESLMLVCTGVKWYSVGYGRSTLYQFTQLTKDVSAAGTITLTAAEAANKLITFIGNPAGAVTVVIPSIVAVYYTYSSISTAQTITFKTAAGAGVGITQGSRIIALCDGTNVLSAQSAISNSSVSLTDGSAAIPALFFATQTNTGLYKSGTQDVGVAINGSSVGVFGSTGLQTSTLGANSTQRHTVPAVSSDTFTLNTATQTLTNKTITGGSAALSLPSSVSVNSASTALTITQTGTGNALVVEDSASTDSTPFVIDASGNVGVGTTTPVDKLQVAGGHIYVSAFAAASRYRFTRAEGTVSSPTAVSGAVNLGFIEGLGYDGTGYQSVGQMSIVSDGAISSTSAPGYIRFATSGSGSVLPTERMRIDSAGSVGIGGASAAGTSLRVTKNITGSVYSSGLVSDGTVISDVTSRADMFLAAPWISASAFTLSRLVGYKAQLSSIGAGATVTNASAFEVDASWVGATNSYGFYGNIASGTGRWNFYAAGTADNYFAGNVGVGIAPYTTGSAFSKTLNGNHFFDIRNDSTTSSTDAAIARLITSDVAGTGNATFDIVKRKSGEVSFNSSETNTAAYVRFNIGGSERMRISSSGDVTVSGPALLGYGTGAGAGGTVTQATSKSTAVTLNKPTGQITMNNAALAAGTIAEFVVNDSLISATDTVIVNIKGGVSSFTNYRIWAGIQAAGQFVIELENRTGGSLSEAVVINFAVIKGAIA